MRGATYELFSYSKVLNVLWRKNKEKVLVCISPKFQNKLMMEHFLPGNNGQSTTCEINISLCLSLFLSHIQAPLSLSLYISNSSPSHSLSFSLTHTLHSLSLRSSSHLSLSLSLSFSDLVLIFLSHSLSQPWLLLGVALLSFMSLCCFKCILLYSCLHKKYQNKPDPPMTHENKAASWNTFKMYKNLNRAATITQPDIPWI